MQIIVLHKQTLIDVAIQGTGKAENLLKIAMANGMVPTEPIGPGTTITIPDTVAVAEDIARYYTANNVLPATSVNEELQVVELNCEEKLYECFKD